MLIKEYRIPLPLSLEDYKIAQLYMIQKKSREESEGEGSAVEILENHPYTDGPNGSGQYTYKIFHIGRHLPSWFRNIAPKTALEVHEESWNAYPYTKTKFSVPFVDKFSLEVETYFEPDNGCQDNKFKLKSSELRQREVDVIDIVNDQLSGSDYKKEEDPRIYVSEKNGRGPLKEDWISNPPNGVIMCAYKLIKVEFRYWGLQSKVERFIHDYGLRRVMLRAHRQVWAWQDEWVGLTMEEIRRLERETQLILQRKLGRAPLEEEEEENDSSSELSPFSSSSAVVAAAATTTTTSGPAGPTNSTATATTTSPIPVTPKSASSVTTLASTSSSTFSTPLQRMESQVKARAISMKRQSSADTFLERRRSSYRKRPSFRHSNASSTTGSLISVHTDGTLSEPLLVKRDSRSTRSSMEGERGEVDMRPEWVLDQIELSDSGSDLEFFDAKDTVEEEDSLDEGDDDKFLDSVEMADTSAESAAIVTNKPNLKDLQAASFDGWLSGDESNICESKGITPDILFLVFHGGSIMDPISDRVGKTLDFTTLKTNMDTIMQLHFNSAIGRVAMRMVPCKNICNSAFTTLCEVSPVPVTTQQCGEGLLPLSTLEPAHAQQPFPSNFGSEPCRDCPCFLPVGVIPLIATQYHTYHQVLDKAVRVANKVYQEFLESEEGQNFSGQVCLIGDCMGSVICYDILTSNSTIVTKPSLSPSSPPPISSSPTPPAHSPSGRQRGGGERLTSDGQSSKASPEKPIKRATTVTPDAKGSASHHLRPHKLLPDSHKEHSLTSLHSANSSSSSIGGSFFFEVSHFFAFGSPLGLILANRRAQNMATASSPPPPPLCQAFYNVFYGVDQIASRVEPLLDGRFAAITPIYVPAYRAFPTGSDELCTLKDTVVRHPYLLQQDQDLAPGTVRPGSSTAPDAVRPGSSTALFSIESDEENSIDVAGSENIRPFSVWWANDRLDYVLEAPWGKEVFETLPTSTFSHIVHSRYWEAKELVSFILRRVLHQHVVCVQEGSDGKEAVPVPFVPRESVVKWKKRTTSMRISVEVYAFLKSPKPRWEYCGSKVVDKHGKVMFTLPRPFSPGLYPIKFLVKGDHTTASCNLFVVPMHVEAVVFSVDGALASNFSLSAKDIKLKSGAVEVVRAWQELGYLIIYLSGRPDLQKDYILNFLGAHGFPLGLVSCAESLSADSQSIKTACLARLIKQAKIIIHAGYGSNRHLPVYKELGLQADQIYIHGRKAKTRQPSVECQYLDGFSAHNAEMLSDPPRKAMHNAREWFGDTRFVLPGCHQHQHQHYQKKKSQPATSYSTTSSSSSSLMSSQQSQKRSAFKYQKSVSIDSQQPKVTGSGSSSNSRKAKYNTLGAGPY